MFGFVYSGLDVGAALIPLVFGWLLDHRQPQWMYVVLVGAMLLSAVTVLNMRSRARPLPAAAD